MQNLFLSKYAPVLLFLAASITLLHFPDVASDPVTQAIEFAEGTNEAARESQQRINRLDTEARAMLEEYRAILRQTYSLQTYREQLKKVIRSQRDEKKSLLEQLNDMERTQREIVPLMLHMIDTIEQFVELDVPFLPDERAERIKRLRKIMEQPDATIAERFRRILEAYQVEIDYGRTFEAYRAPLEAGKTTRIVDFLRIGRTVLYYQTLDGRESGFWDQDTRQWDILPDRYRRSIQQGIRIARKQTAPQLLELPIPTPEVTE